MEILEYYSAENKNYWLRQIEKNDWRAGRYLYELLSKGQLKDFCGEKTEVLMLAEGDELVSFCIYAEQDEIREPSLTPWTGFVYTFPQYRGRRCVGKLLEYACELAKKDGYRQMYISTGEVGLYEKYGYSFWKVMKNGHGEDCRVYRKEIVPEGNAG